VLEEAKNVLGGEKDILWKEGVMPKGKSNNDYKESLNTGSFSLLILFALMLLLAAFQTARGDEGKAKAGDGSRSNPYSVPKTTQTISVDGVLDEEVWQGALALELRYEVEPGENIEPPVRTECFITYNDSRLFAAFKCYDSETGLIRANFSDRDRIESDDYVMLQLDTFNDERRAFVFASNPLGVQWDAVHVNQSWDSTWDAIWDCAGRTYEWGYAVEFAIPFDQLRFVKSGEAKVWGFDANRILPRGLEHTIGAFPRDRSNNCYHCQMLKIEGFDDATPGRNLELAPTVTAVRTDARSELPAGDFQKVNQDAEVGLTAKWGLTSNMTLQAAANPDFSQVEADALQLDINQPFALFYREKRPFFTEGADYFETLANRMIEDPLFPVYTRTIRDPLWGMKLTGKEGANTFGGFVVQDDITNLIFPGEEWSRSASMPDANYSSVFRYRRDAGNKYSLGALLTDREGNDYFNRVFGFDGDFRFTDRDRLVIQALGSSTQYPSSLAEGYGQEQGEFSDYIWMFHYRHGTRNYRVYADYQDVGTGFRADLGYMPRVGYTKGEVGVGYTWWGESGDFLNRMNFDANFDQTRRQNGDLMEREIELLADFMGPWQSMAFVYYGARNRVYEGNRFSQDFKGFFFAMQPSGRLSLMTMYAFEDKIDYSHGRPASEFCFAQNMAVNVTRSLNFDLSYTYLTLKVEGGRLFRVNAMDATLIYQFDRRTFIRAILQYTDIEQNQELYAFTVDRNSNSLFTQFLFSYKINPRTVLFIGYTDNYFGNQDFSILQTDRTFFVKLGYAWTL
jgi:hypothetical protein